MSEHSPRKEVAPRFTRDEQYHLTGWVLFIASAAFFAWAGVQFRSVSTILGSVVFGAACVVFMVPILVKQR